MSEVWANEFREILPTLQQRADLSQRVLDLLPQETVAMVTEGGDRLARFRVIMVELVNGQLTLDGAYRMTERELPRHMSPHARNNQVFARRWPERHVRTTLSLFYNWAVLEYLRDAGETSCFVPHSSEEDRNSSCSRQLAGREHNIATFHANLVAGYCNEDWSRGAKIPHHPWCSHVVRPVRVKDVMAIVPLSTE